MEVFEINALFEDGGKVHSNFMRENNKKTMNVLETARQACYQLVKEGSITPEIFKEINRPLISREEYMA
jgi:hypothetical protein